MPASRHADFSRPSRAACAAIVSLIFVTVAFARAAARHEQPDTHSASEFQNPVIWEDLADLDIFRVGNTYYYSASNMHYSPGAPILRSYDLVHWEYIGHSVPRLDFGPAYDLNGGNAYVKGSWASFLGYRKSNQTFYWGGCIQFSKTYIYTAKSAAGPWSRHAVLPKCYYDAGLLTDDDGNMYVAYGNTTLHVAQLSPDATREVKSETVFTAPPDVKVLEGSRFYKVNGNYYIFTDHPPDGEYVLKSSTGPFGPYTMRPLVSRTISPVPGAGSPHQGGIVQTQHGNWYYMAFIDAYPGGRIPVMAPLQWSADGWPAVKISDNTWAASYPYPLPPHPLAPLTGTDRFEGPALSPQWEWNHNPDNTKWMAAKGLTLQTSTVTDDLYQARNTLTHRILGPQSSATVVLDDSGMKDGDRAGLAILRDSSAWIGIERDHGTFRIVMEDNIVMNNKWQTISTGTEVAASQIPVGKIWLRASADIRPGAGRTAHFSWSDDGRTFHNIGTAFAMKTDWHFFMGYRYAIFNYATKSLGGKIHVASFSMTKH
jgi:beta-xylosidase